MEYLLQLRMLLPLSAATVIGAIVLWLFCREELKRLSCRALIVLLCGSGIATVTAQKGTNGTSAAEMPRMMMRQLASAPESSPVYYGMFPVWTNAVTNVCITGMKLTDTSVVSRVHHPADILPAATGIAVYAMPSLAADDRYRIGTAPIAGGADGTIIEFPYSILPEGWLYSMFFRFALTDDFDGDELPDIAETGGIRQLGEYQYYDLNGATDWIANYAFSGTDIITLALPDEAVIAGEHYDRVSVDIHGIVYLIPVGGSPVTTASAQNQDLRCWDPGTTNLAVAAYWGDLVRSAYYPTKLRTVYVESDDCFVVDYAAFTMNYSPYGWLSFQIVIPLSGASDVIRVNYSVVSLDLEPYDSTVGFMKSSVRSDNPGERNYCQQWRYNGGNAVGSGMSLEFRIGTGTDPKSEDTDCDGLSDSAEILFGTNPRQPDTDGDGYDDGWECLHAAQGFDPLFPNASGSTGPDGDLDGDGLTNREECELGTDPNALDSDGDGVNDYVEIAQNSDPADGSDNGEANSRVAATFRFGDDSPSHSEKYRLEISPISGPGDRPRGFSWPDAHYGVPETKRAMLKPGWRYEIRLEHAGTDPGYHDDPCPDYDYVLQFVGADSSPSVILDDPQGLFGGNDNSGESFTGEGKVAYLYVLGNPRLVFDYDRDGKIDDADVAKAKEGKTFRFWINDDVDGGDVCLAADYCSDFPGDWNRSDEFNYSNDIVDGRRDLLDFTPAWIDLSSVFPPDVPADLRNGITWRLKSSSMNAVWTSLSKDSAGSFQRQDCSGCGNALDKFAYEADVVRLPQFTSGVQLPSAFLTRIEGSEDDGIVLLEGVGGVRSVEIIGLDSSSNVVAGCSVPVIISSVEDMYRWVNLRSSCGDHGGLASNTNSPFNRPDSECDGRQFVFVHGFNVNTEEARASAAEVFKRLWQSGSDSMFTAVEWYGDQEQTDIIEDIRGTVSLNYYANAFHAFETAPDLVTACAALPGTNKVVIAHSLGNVLVSSAAVDWGLAYDRYYMLNAAVAMEAYDGTEYADDMIDSDWMWTTNSVYANWRASRWSGLFGPEDFRSTLSWKGRFAGIRNAVNCYSTTEDVVGNPKEPSLSLAWADWVLQQPVWVMQERVKGTLLVDVIDIWPWSHLGCEGGWGRNAHYPLWCTTGSTNGLSNITREAMIEHPLFTPFTSETEKMSSTNLFSVSDVSAGPPLRARFLADAIPAESHAAGGNYLKIFEEKSNVQMDKDVRNGGCMANVDKWPEMDNDDNPIWRHSAFKQVAYFFTYGLFDLFVKGN